MIKKQTSDKTLIIPRQLPQYLPATQSDLATISADDLLILINEIGTSFPPSKTENLFIELSFAVNDFNTKPTQAAFHHIAKTLLVYLNHNITKQQMDDS